MERLQIVGTLQRNDVSPARTSAAVVTLELPSQVRLDEQLPGFLHSAASDQNGSGANDGAISAADGDLLQTILLNWSGTFFSQVGGGASSRLLGARFRLIPAPQGGQQQYHTLVQAGKGRREESAGVQTLRFQRRHRPSRGRH
jgi:hypothetical protein